MALCFSATAQYDDVTYRWWSLDGENLKPYYGKSSSVFATHLDSAEIYLMLTTVDGVLSIDGKLTRQLTKNNSLFLEYDRPVKLIFYPEDQAKAPQLLIHKEKLSDTFDFSYRSDYFSSAAAVRLLLSFLVIIGLTVINNRGVEAIIPWKVIQFNIRPDSMARSKTLSGDVFILMFALSVLSTLILTDFTGTDTLTVLFGIQKAGVLNMVVSFIFLGLFLLRLLNIYLISGVFGLRGFGNYQFTEYIRISFLITFYFAAAVYLADVIFVFKLSAGHPVFYFFFFLMIILRTIIIFIKLITYTSHRNLYLFLYLCISEIIPLLIGIKVLDSI